MSVYFLLGIVFFCAAIVFAQGPGPSGEEATEHNRAMYRLATVLLALAGVVNMALGLWQWWRGEA